MSKHTLSGVDLSNRQSVNKNIEIDNKNDKIKKPKYFKNLQDIKDYYGVDLDTPLLDFEGLSINDLKRQYGHSELPEGTEFYQGGFLDPTKEGTVLDKNRPKNLLRPLASFADLIMRDTTDFDKLGILGEGRYKDLSKTIDKDDLSKYLIPLAERKNLETKLDTAFPEEMPDKEELIEESIQEELSRREVIDPLDRKKRREQAIETLVSNTVSMPIYTRLLEDAAKRRLELDKAMLGAREMMPSNIQNIMLSKQAQQQMASSAFAEEAKALATQQDAATRFAGLGMQRPFGQV